MPPGEAGLLARYHLRLLDRWPFPLLALLFVVAALPLVTQTGTAENLHNVTEVGLFALEAGAALFAGLFSSSLIVGDPLLEVMMATRSGITAATLWRGALSLVPLLICCAAYQALAAATGIKESLALNPLTWLAPLLLMAMLGLFGSLLTRNAALGTVLAVVPLAGSLFLFGALYALPAARPFLFTYTYSTFASGLPQTEWLTNRLALLGIALLLAVLNWLLLRREERLLGSAR